MPGLPWSLSVRLDLPETDFPTDLIRHSLDRARPEFWFWFLILGSERKVQLVVAGACEGPQDASAGTGSFHFHYPAFWEQDLNVHLQVVCLAPGTHWPSSLSLSA